MSKNKTMKKFLIILFIIVTALSTFTAYNATALAETVAESHGDGRDPVDGSEARYTLQDLIEQFDIFCCQKSVHAFIYEDDIITNDATGATYKADDNSGSTIDAGYYPVGSTYPTFSSHFSSGVGEGGTVTALISDYEYTVSDEKAAPAKEAYILAEVNNDTDLSTYEYVKDASGNRVQLTGVDVHYFDKVLQINSCYIFHFRL